MKIKSCTDAIGYINACIKAAGVGMCYVPQSALESLKEYLIESAQESERKSYLIEAYNETILVGC